MIHGSADQVVPPRASMRIYEALTAAGVSGRVPHARGPDVKGSTVTMLTFTLTDPGLNSVGGLVEYDIPTKTASFDPSVDLAMNTVYTATLTTDVEDTARNSLVVDKVWTFRTGTTTAQEGKQLRVQLGSVAPFAILANAAITNIPTSMITGDVGLSPASGSSASGFAMPLTCPEIIGELYVIDASGPICSTRDRPRLDSAKLSAAAAYLDAVNAVRGPAASAPTNLNGLTLYPGLYESLTTLGISPGGFLYLDAQGDPDAVFIIRSATTITTEPTSTVVLTKGAKATNVFWSAGSAITLGTGSIMKGTLLAGTAISLNNRANLEARAITQGAAATAVTLDQNTISVPLP